MQTINSSFVREDIINDVKNFHAELSDKITLERNMWIYNLLKNGWVTMDHLSKATGYTRQRLYQVIGEIEAINEKNYK